MSLELISEYVKDRYPHRQAVAVIEGLPPLCRIALTARLARRTLRLVTFGTASAQRVVEMAVSAAEKAASGEEISLEESLAARDEAVMAARGLEKREGDAEAADAAPVARYAVRCLSHPELVFGECVFNADMDLQAVIQRNGRNRGLDEVTIQTAVLVEERAFRTDLDRMILYVESSQERWSDPELFKETAIRLQKRNSVFDRIRGEDICGRWSRIHTEIRRARGCFYPPHIFGPLALTSGSRT